MSYLAKETEIGFWTRQMFISAPKFLSGQRRLPRFFLLLVCGDTHFCLNSYIRCVILFCLVHLLLLLCVLFGSAHHNEVAARHFFVWPGPANKWQVEPKEREVSAWILTHRKTEYTFATDGTVKHTVCIPQTWLTDRRLIARGSRVHWNWVIRQELLLSFRNTTLCEHFCC